MPKARRALRVVAEDRRDIEVVGDDAQAGVAQQRLRDRLGGGADVEDQRTVVRHLERHGARNARLAIGMQRFPLRVADVLGGRTRYAHTAVKARQHAFVGQALHVAPHGLQGDAQQVGQLFDRGGPARAHGFEQLELTRVGVHKGECARQGALL